MEVYLVRHGESAANKLLHERKGNIKKEINKLGNPPLTPHGVLQAQVTAQTLISRLRTHKEIKLIVSPMCRAVQTMEPFIQECQKAKLDYTLEYWSELQEYTSTAREVKGCRLENGKLLKVDTWEQFTERMQRLYEKLTEKCLVPRIIVGHSLMFSTLLSYLGSRQTYIIPDRTIVFHLPNCSITTLLGKTKMQKGGLLRQHWEVCQMADISHLIPNLHTGTRVPLLF